MTPDHLITASACFALVWTLGATLAVITHHRPLSFRSILYALVAYVMLCLTVWVDSHVSLGRNAAMHLLYVITSGDPEYLCAAALGVCLGVGPAIWPWQSSWASRPQGWLERTLRCAGLSSIVCALLFIALFALRDKLKPYLVHRGFANIVVNPVGFDTPPGIQARRISPMPLPPHPDCRRPGWVALRDGVPRRRVTGWPCGQATARQPRQHS